MPFIDSKVTVTLTKEKKESIKARLGQAQRKTINSNSTQGSSIGSRTNSDSSNLSRAFTMRDPTKGDTSIGSGNEIESVNNSPLLQFDEFFKKYIPDLTKKELTKKIDQEKSDSMKEYIMKAGMTLSSPITCHSISEGTKHSRKARGLSTDLLTLRRANMKTTS